MAKNDRWWDPYRPLSYNCLFNFIVGMRGVGKTYGSLKRLVKRFLDSPEHDPYQFVYMRRTKEELKKKTTSHNATLFDDIQREFPKHYLHAEADTLYCDKQVMGYGVALSTSTILKSQAFPHVREIVFDEFIIDNVKTYHYLPDEVRKFQDAYETIARPGNDPNRPDTRVWFLSNAVTINNPYFYEFGLSMPTNGDIQRFGHTKDMLVQNVVSRSLAQSKKESRFGRMIKGSRYIDYAYDNQMLFDDMFFIEKKTQRCQYYLSLRYMDTWLGIWYDPLQFLYYVSLDYDKQFPLMYSATTDDHRPNIMLLKHGRSQPFIKQLISAYEMGCVRYESVKLKAMFRDIMGHTY